MDLDQSASIPAESYKIVLKDYDYPEDCRPTKTTIASPIAPLFQPQ
jgi:hypothetical protein